MWGKIDNFVFLFFRHCSNELIINMNCNIFLNFEKDQIGVAIGSSFLFARIFTSSLYLKLFFFFSFSSWMLK